MKVKVVILKMSDNKKYYYLKLKDSFFDSDSMIVLESMPDGYKYSNILLKLYLRSLKNEGKLMFNDRIPYNATILSQVTRHSVGDVEKAIRVFQDLELIEVLDNGAIFITDIQNFIGKSSTEGDRKREYRNKIEKEKTLLIEGGQMSGQTSGQMSDNRPPEKEIEIEIELEKETDINRRKNIDYDDANKNKPSSAELTENFEKLWKLYPKKQGSKKKAFASYKKAIKSGTTNKEIQDGIVAYKKYLQREQWQKPANGDTWFNNERWNDEYETKEEKNVIDDDWEEKLKKDGVVLEP